MPEIDNCECAALIVSQALVEGQSWPECVTDPSIIVSDPKPGACNHPPECPSEDAKRCSFSLDLDFGEHSCLGMVLKIEERAVGAPGWSDLGIETGIPQGPWNMFIRPACGYERKLKMIYGGTSIWEAVVRCSKCNAQQNG